MRYLISWEGGPLLSSPHPLSLYQPPSFLWTRNGRAPSGVTSEATQRCCENNCHNIHYHDQAEQAVKERHQAAGKLVKEETQTLTKTRERHKGKSAVLLQTVQTESKLPLCVSNSLLGTQRDFHVSALCVEDPSHHHRCHPSKPSTPTIDAIEATRPPSTPSKPPPSTPSTQSTPPFDAIEATIDAIEATTIDAIDATQAINSSHFPFAHSRISVEVVTSATLHPPLSEPSPSTSTCSTTFLQVHPSVRSSQSARSKKVLKELLLF